jgi:hypothetical protein
MTHPLPLRNRCVTLVVIGTSRPARLQQYVLYIRSRQGSARAGRHHTAFTTHDLLLLHGGAGRPPVPRHRPFLADGEQTATRQTLA